MKEEALIKRLTRQEPEALSEAMDRYGPYVRTVLYNVLRDRGAKEDLEELASDVFLSLWQHAGEIRQGSLKPWLGAVARNRAKSFLRSRRFFLPMDQDVLEWEGPSPETEAEQRELRQKLLAAVRSLPPPDKEIFLRYYYEYQTVEQIAAAMDKPVGTVKSRLSRGRKRLKKVLSRWEAET